MAIKTVADLLEVLNKVEDKSMEVWIFDEQCRTYESITNVAIGSFEGKPTLDISSNVIETQ